MFIKQPGSYKRLIQIAKQDYPNMKPLSTQTVMLEGFPVLLMRFETGESLGQRKNPKENN